MYTGCACDCRRGNSSEPVYLFSEVAKTAKPQRFTPLADRRSFESQGRISPAFFRETFQKTLGRVIVCFLVNHGPPPYLTSGGLSIHLAPVYNVVVGTQVTTRSLLGFLVALVALAGSLMGAAFHFHNSGMALQQEQLKALARQVEQIERHASSEGHPGTRELLLELKGDVRVLSQRLEELFRLVEEQR